MRSNDVSIALRRVLRPSGYELGGPGVCEPSLLLAPGVGQSLRQPGDGEIGWRVAVGDRRNDARICLGDGMAGRTEQKL